MAQLAIRGHITRGNEVIELLEMLGGKNDHIYGGSATDYVYSINEHGIIDWYIPHPNIPLAIFTLKEFLEKFPYKVGDTVLYEHDDKIFFIRKMFWENDKILYELSDEVYSDGCSMPDTLIFDVDVVKLQPYKEATMEDKGTLVQIDLTRELRVADEVEVILGDYEFVLKEGKTYFVKKKPQYPKTYEECCDILNIPSNGNIAYVGNWVYGGEYLEKHLDRLRKFQQLLICRDAYWKIAGEQMGLGKPWEPDWLNVEQDKFVLYTHDDVICLNRFVLGHNVLAFPTAEMRDAFLENFKNLIESCKELL